MSTSDTKVGELNEPLLHEGGDFKLNTQELM